MFLFSWWHKLVQSDQYYPLPEEHSTKLIWSKVNASNAGWYKCEAMNSGGSAEADIAITVWCKPHISFCYSYYRYINHCN